jgi:predicted DNA-binding transcriptional regulator YafY
MSQMERIYKLDRLFRRKKPPGKREILEVFEISPAQFKRDLDYMRNRLGAPVTFDNLLGKSGRGTESILERMQVSAAPQRPIDPEHFQAISDATLRRKKLRMRYYSRSRGAESDRTVSPERLIYYRGNWYLDAWCHEKAAMRRFAIDAVRLVSVLEEPALEVATSF